MTDDDTAGELEQPSMTPFFVGLSLPDKLDNAASALEDARKDGFDFVTTSLSMDQPRPDVTVLSSSDWTRFVVGEAATSSSSLSLSGLEWACHMNLPAVLLPKVVMDVENNNNSVCSYARELIHQLLNASAAYAFQLWVPITLNAQSLAEYQTLYKWSGENHHLAAALYLDLLPPTSPSPLPHDDDDSIIMTDATADAKSPFVRMSAAQAQAYYLRLLHVAIGCNIRCVILPTHLFLTNKKGYPTLPKMMQFILEELMRRVGRTVRFLIQGPSNHILPSPSARGQTGCLPYLQYVQHVRKRSTVTSMLDSPESHLESPYLDVLQKPLQPLKDHLENGSYEVFEKDPVKYQQYEHAIRAALEDLVSARRCFNAGAGSSGCNVFVLGAGRGPLVSCIIRAYQQLCHEPQTSNNSPPLINHFHIVMVEKSPCAVLFLKSKLICDPVWINMRNQLTLVQGDLRSLTSKHVGGRKCDIAVSELLGSLGDNELSPECLDGFFSNAHICHANTISIPSSYTAYLSPVHSANLHLEVQNQALYPNDQESDVLGTQIAAETPYVVRPHAASQMCPEHVLWTFQHPHSTTTSGTHNNRQREITFVYSPTLGTGWGSGYGPIDQRMVEATALDTGTSVTNDVPWILNGFMGSFTAILYEKKSTNEKIQISNAPSSFSIGMFSWFPLYFPLRESVWVPPGATIKTWFWRHSDAIARRIWYEWSVAIFAPDGKQLLSISPIHNPSGRSSHVALDYYRKNTTAMEANV